MDSIKGHECSQHSELDNWLLEADIATFILNPREQRLGNFAQWKSDEVDMASSTEWTRQYQYENYRLEELQDWLIKEEMEECLKDPHRLSRGNFARWYPNEPDVVLWTEWIRQYQIDYENDRWEVLADWLTDEEIWECLGNPDRLSLGNFARWNPSEDDMGVWMEWGQQSRAERDFYQEVIEILLWDEDVNMQNLVYFWNYEEEKCCQSTSLC